MELADRKAGGRVVSALEGGYDLQGLAQFRRRACHRADAGMSDAVMPARLTRRGSSI